MNNGRQASHHPYHRGTLLPLSKPIVPGATRECSHRAARANRSERAETHPSPPAELLRNLITSRAATGALRFPPIGFISFNSHLWVVFNFPSQYSFAIGLAAIFSFARFVPRALRCIPKHRDSTKTENFEPIAHTAMVRGYHPLWRAFPGHFCCAARNEPYNPCLSNHTTARAIQRAPFQVELLPLHSPLLGQSQLLSFPPLSDMLNFSGYSRRSEVQKVQCGAPEAGQ